MAALTANGVGTCGADDNQAQAGHLIAATLRTREGHGCERGDGQDNLIPLAFHVTQDPISGDVAPAMGTGSHDSGGPVGLGVSEEMAYSLRAGRTQSVAAQAVRRLTPMECERLQGFPDGWTDGQADSARYRQMGNAVAVPVVEWIIRRIVAIDARVNAPEGVA